MRKVRARELCCSHPMNSLESGHKKLRDSFKFFQKIVVGYTTSRTCSRSLEKHINESTYTGYHVSIFSNSNARDRALELSRYIVELSRGCGVNAKSLAASYDFARDAGEAFYLCTLQHQSSTKAKKPKAVLILRVDEGKQTLYIVLLCCTQGLGLGTRIVESLKQAFPHYRLGADAVRSAVPFWYKMGFLPESEDGKMRFRGYFNCPQAPRSRLELISLADWAGSGTNQLNICDYQNIMLYYS